MRRFFADTFYWIALFSPKDAWHERVLTFSQSVGPCRLYTTEEVLAEFLTFCSAAGPQIRQQAAELVRSLFNDPGVTYTAFTKGKDQRKLGEQYDMVKTWIERHGEVSAPSATRITKQREAKS